MPATKSRNPFHAAAGLKVDQLFKANADLSTCQFRFVKLHTVVGEVAGATAGSNPYPIGVLQNAPSASGIAVVRVMGETSIVLPATPCTLKYGDFITSTGCGGAAYSGASGAVLGRWLSASVASAPSASSLGTILVNTITPSASLQSAS